MYYNSILLITLSLLNFSNQKTTNTTKSNTITNTIFSDSSYNTHFYIKQYYPYCGGASPTEGMMNNYAPASGPFTLINHSNATESSVISKNGTIKLQLEPGKYLIRETYKNIPFSEFYAKYSTEYGMNKQTLCEDCYKTWWESNLFEFEITDSTTLIKEEATISSQCFTGINPCQIYTGPWPP